MRITTILLICLLVLLTGCYLIQNPDGNSSPIITPDVDDELNNELSFEDSLPEITWTTFESPELGLSFRYPEALDVQTSTQIEGFDIGKKFEISTASFTIAAMSSDFGLGVGEGCCFYFSSEPLNLTVSDEEVIEQIESQLGKISDFQRIEIDTLPAVSFMRTNKYVDSWEVETVLLPYEKFGYSNIMISGPGRDADQEEKEFFDEILANMSFE